MFCTSARFCLSLSCSVTTLSFPNLLGYIARPFSIYYRRYVTSWLLHEILLLKPTRPQRLPSPSIFHVQVPGWYQAQSFSHVVPPAPPLVRHVHGPVSITGCLLPRHPCPSFLHVPCPATHSLIGPVPYSQLKVLFLELLGYYKKGSIYYRHNAVLAATFHFVLKSGYKIEVLFIAPLVYILLFVLGTCPLEEQDNVTPSSDTIPSNLLNYQRIVPVSNESYVYAYIKQLPSRWCLRAVKTRCTWTTLEGPIHLSAWAPYIVSSQTYFYYSETSFIVFQWKLKFPATPDLSTRIRQVPVIVPD